MYYWQLATVFFLAYWRIDNHRTGCVNFSAAVPLDLKFTLSQGLQSRSCGFLYFVCIDSLDLYTYTVFATMILVEFSFCVLILWITLTLCLQPRFCGLLRFACPDYVERFVYTVSTAMILWNSSFCVSWFSGSWHLDMTSVMHAYLLVFFCGTGDWAANMTGNTSSLVAE